MKSLESENIPEGLLRDHQDHAFLTNIFVTAYNLVPFKKHNEHILSSFNWWLMKGLTFTRSPTDAKGISLNLFVLGNNKSSHR